MGMVGVLIRRRGSPSKWRGLKRTPRGPKEGERAGRGGGPKALRKQLNSLGEKKRITLQDGLERNRKE